MPLLESTLLLYNSNSNTMDLFDELSEVTDSSNDGEEWDSKLDCDFEIDPDYVSDGDEYDPLGPDRVAPDSDSDDENTDSVPVPIVPISLRPSISQSHSLGIPLAIRPGDTVLHRSASTSSFTSQTSQSSQNSQKGKVKGQSNHSIGTQIHALALFEAGWPEMDYKAITGVSQRTVYNIRSKAVSRGWVPGTAIQVEHVDDKPRSGRPKTGTATVLKNLEIVTRNSTTRGWSYGRIAGEFHTLYPSWQEISASTVYRVLKENRYGVFKRTVKPGLNKAQKEARLA